MHPNPVVVERDALEDIPPRLLPRLIVPFLDKLPLERLEERFRRCATQRSSRPGYRLRCTMRIQTTLERLVCVLDTLIVTEDEAAVTGWIFSSRGLFDDIDGDLFGDPIRHRPACRLAGGHIDHGSQAGPALSGRHIGYVPAQSLFSRPRRRRARRGSGADHLAPLSSESYAFRLFP